MILPPKGAIPSAPALAEVVTRTKVDIALVVLLIIEEMSKSPELLDKISKSIDTIVYSGGDVPQGYGDKVAARILIVNFYGSTEGASLALVRPKRLSIAEWKFLAIHPDARVEFRYYVEDIFELFIVKQPGLETHQQIFTTFPNLPEFPTRDLFKPHPMIEGLWSHCGRTDDTIVFLNSEKVNPIYMEQFIFSQNTEISGVLVAGNQKFQTAILIEITQNADTAHLAKIDFVERI